MTASSTCDEALLQEVLSHACESIAALIDRSLTAELTSHERMSERPAGAGVIHISFKLQIERDGTKTHGCVLAPLPHAIALASYLLMMPDQSVAEQMERDTLDEDLKDALLEVGNLISGAATEAYRALGLDTANVRSAGCQGVRADVRPAFPYEEGSELIVGRAQATLADFEPFELLTLLPALEE